MKKTLIMFVIFSIMCTVFGCAHKEEIRSITINDEIYYSLYVYSFDDAEIATLDKAMTYLPVDHPAESGYVISSEKNAMRIKVWERFVFDDDTSNAYSSGDFGTDANVVDLVEEFPITIKEKTDTFVVTYYTYNVATYLDFDKLINSELSKHTVEVTKENILIEYN